MNQWTKEIRCLWWRKNKTRLIAFCWWGQRQSVGPEVYFCEEKLLFILSRSWKLGVDSKVDISIPDTDQRPSDNLDEIFTCPQQTWPKLGQCCKLFKFFFIFIFLFTLKAWPLFWNYVFSAFLVLKCVLLRTKVILCVCVCLCVCVYVCMFWLGKNKGWWSSVSFLIKKWNCKSLVHLIKGD